MDESAGGAGGGEQPEFTSSELKRCVKLSHEMESLLVRLKLLWCLTATVYGVRVDSVEWTTCKLQYGRRRLNEPKV